MKHQQKTPLDNLVCKHVKQLLNERCISVRQPNNGIRRTGIRIHAGNTIADSRGCILVGSADRDYKTMGRSGEARLLSSRKALNELREYLLNYQKEYPNEEIYIEITEPDAYPLYDVPYERELQKP